MENTPADNGSDRDKRMMNSFESFSDSKENSKEKKKDKKKDKPSVGVEKTEEKKSEVRGNIFEPAKPEKADQKPEQLDETKDPEVLDEAETKAVAEKYVELRSEELHEELEQVVPDSPEEAAALANAALIEVVREKLDAGEPPDEETLDRALAETTAELELEATETEAEAPSDEEEDDPSSTTPSTATRGVTSPPPPPTPPVPTPAFPPAGAPLPLAFGPLGGAPTPGPAPGNTLQPNPNVLPPRYQRGADLLVGGVIGYLIGRRRGRIKTEQRLIPLQHKLEKEVKNLQEKIAVREEKIRTVTLHQVETAPAAAPKIIERLEARQEQKRSTVVETQTNSLPTPERLGRVLVPRPEAIETPKSVETMTLPELLQTAQKIEVEGVTVRRMYEAGRLDAVGLRRVVSEYLRDGEYKKRLNEYLRPPESSPEILRQPLSGMDSGDATGGGTYATGVTSAMSVPRPPESSPNALQPSNQLQSHSAQPKQHKTGLWIFLAVAITLLLVFLWVR